MLSRCCWLVVALIAVSGCATKKQLPAEEYFRQANEDFRGGAYLAAVESYRDLLDQHPFSEHTEEAELRIAQAQYLEGDYVSSIIALSDFQRRYPTSPNLALVGYLLGMCYVQQMGTVDRDQTAAQSAHAYFTTLLNQFPESPFAELGRGQLAACRESLAAHQVYVAEYYEKRGNTRAAELRLLLMAAEYGDTPSAADGLLELTKTYADWRNEEYATLTYRALQQLHPNTVQAKDAALLVDPAMDERLPATADPIDLLLIANGRQRPQASYTIPEAPRFPSARSGGGAPGPAMPQIDPFGGGGGGY